MAKKTVVDDKVLGDCLKDVSRAGALLQADVPAGSGPGTSTCMLRRIGLLGFKIAPMLDLRVAPTSTDCTIEMLSFKVYAAASSSNVCSDPRLF